MNVLLNLFLTFFKLGAFTFGGGYAMISLIENEVVTKKGWLSRDEMLDIITIAESTPGPLAINMATFVGTKIKGILGAIIATVGLVIPPFVIISCIALVLNEFKEIAVIAYALKGIQAGVVVLIFNAFLKFFKGMDKSVMSYIFLVSAFLISLLTDFYVVLIILIGAVIGVSVMFLTTHIKARKESKNSPNQELAGGNNDISDASGSTEMDASDDIDATSDDANSDSKDSEKSDIECTQNKDNITIGDEKSVKINSNDVIDGIISDDSVDVESSDDESNSQNSDTYSIVRESDEKEGDGV